MNNKNRAVFLTGATGLVGSYLLKMLLHNDYKVYVLARKNQQKTAQKRVTGILNFWDPTIVRKKSKNLHIFEGNIEKKDLGLSKNEKKILKCEIGQIFHCAALTKLNESLKKLRLINVESSKKVFDFAYECSETKKPIRVNYLSTVYVCGNYCGAFKEDDLDMGQQFNTFYERSKFEAEELIYNYRKKGLWIDIFRPSLVLGESFSGKIPFFNQAFFQAIRAWNLEILDYFPNARSHQLNIVFVDELVRSLLCITNNFYTINETYHLFSQRTISLFDILSYVTDFLKLKNVKFINADKFNEISTPAQKKLAQYNFAFINNRVKLKSFKTNKLLKKVNFSFSVPDQNHIKKLLSFAVKNGFLKKKN